jgi:hypothetical protein
LKFLSVKIQKQFQDLCVLSQIYWREVLIGTLLFPFDLN